MSSKGRKTSSTGKVRFVKVGGKGELASAFPKKGKHRPKESATMTTELPEPKFAFEQAEATEANLKEPQSLYEEELSVLKSKVDHISKDPKRRSLTKPQSEILKKYIDLREKESRDVRDQLLHYEAYVKKLAIQMEQIQEQSEDLARELDISQKKEEDLRQRLGSEEEKNHEELDRLRNDFDEKLKSSDKYEVRLHSLKKEREEWKGKIREDLRRIKLKERELENKYELFKRDAQALLDSKDRHVIELEKKNNALELDLENKDETLQKNNRILSIIDAKKKRLVETLRLAISLLEKIDYSDEDISKETPESE